MRTVFVRLAIVGCGHTSELLAYLRTGASVRGSSANVASATMDNRDDLSAW